MITPSTSGRFGFRVGTGPIVELFQRIDFRANDSRREFLVEGRWSKVGEWHPASIAQQPAGAGLHLDLGRDWLIEGQDHADFVAFASGALVVVNVFGS